MRTSRRLGSFLVVLWAAALTACTPNGSDAGIADSSRDAEAGALPGDALGAEAGIVAAALALGYQHSCARLTDGTARCWGRGFEGQLGDGVTAHQMCREGFTVDDCSPVPVAVTGFSAAAQISSGSSHACALQTDGTVLCWGYNQHGQLGDGTSRANRRTAVPVIGLAGVAQISANYAYTCARLDDGTVRCWGDNMYGQLGDGTTTTRLTPVTVPGLAGVSELAGGAGHVCARLGDGTVKCWGSNGAGQLGDGTYTSRMVPTTVGGLVGVAQIAAGGGFTCARLTNLTVRCWGAAGHVGDGSSVGGQARMAPTPVANLSNVTDISASVGHACVLVANRTARCWGNNFYGELGDGTRTDRTEPVAVASLSDVAQISLGHEHTCARMGDGTARCWGRNNAGQLGDGTNGSSRVVPVTVIAR